MEKDTRIGFGSKLGMMLATAGSAVGLGNVWRFPYMTGNDGGAAFILVYIGCVILLAIPCMISEFIIGRESGSNAARAYRKLAPRSILSYTGYIGVFAAFLISTYYAVISGWCVQYVGASLMGSLHGSTEYFQTYFNDFAKGTLNPIILTVVILLFTHIIIIKGVRGGIEKASKMMMPALFIILVVMVFITCTLPDADKGIEYLLYPDFTKITPSVFIDALGQSFYSMSIAMGILCTYASYYVRSVKLEKTAYQIGAIDFLVAILSGLIIFPAAFSVGISPDSGPSLLFETIPVVFDKAFADMPIIGYCISLMFYCLLSLAAITSLISLHEVSTSFIMEEAHLSRTKSTTIVTVAACVMGALCSLSYSDVDWLKIGGMSLFGFLDMITGQYMLPLGGLLSCIFVGWILPKKMLKGQYTNWGAVHTYSFNWYYFCVKFLCPILILMIFLHQFEII